MMIIKPESGFSRFSCPCLILFAVILGLLAGLLFAAVFDSGCNNASCDNTFICEGGLCVSQIESATEIGDNVVSLSVPANSAITKIVVTMIQDNITPIAAGYIEVFQPAPTQTFETYFPKAPGDAFISYELNFASPLCVGEDGATVFLIPLGGNLQQVTASRLILNVLYCPDACTDSNGNG